MLEGQGFEILDALNAEEAVRVAAAHHGPVQRSTSTSACCPEHPWASFEVPRSKVRTFGLPCTHIVLGSAGSRGSYQAPVESCTTRGRTAGVTTAPARQLPRSLKTRTT